MGVVFFGCLYLFRTARVSDEKKDVDDDYGAGIEHEDDDDDCFDEYAAESAKVMSMKKEDILMMLKKNREVMEWIKEW